MLWFGLLLLVLIGALGWYLFRPNADNRADSRPEARAREARLEKRLVRTPRDVDQMGDVRGLTLKIPNLAKACDAARKDANKTFVAQEAPPLPLSGCSAELCECSYHAIPGRRSSQERRAGVDRRADLRFEADKSDRRGNGDRRRYAKDKWKGRA